MSSATLALPDPEDLEVYYQHTTEAYRRSRTVEHARD